MIAIVDYGVGNLRSVEKALQYIGLNAEISSDAGTIRRADAVVLPGVGAFSDAMRSLEKYQLADVVRETVEGNRPFLGICLGMQLLFEYSEEGHGHVQGLGLFKGAIKGLPLNMGLKVPHIGWNSLKADEGPLFKGLPENPYVYFVHSYYLEAKERTHVTATCDYGIEFDAAIGSGRVFAVQFHPEKSGETGLQLLKNWAELI